MVLLIIDFQEQPDFITLLSQVTSKLFINAFKLIIFKPTSLNCLIMTVYFILAGNSKQNLGTYRLIISVSDQLELV